MAERSLRTRRIHGGSAGTVRSCRKSPCDARRQDPLCWRAHLTLARVDTGSAAFRAACSQRGERGLSWDLAQDFLALAVIHTLLGGRTGQRDREHFFHRGYVVDAEPFELLGR